MAECWPDKPDLVAIDGKTSRRSHDDKRGQKALHLVFAFATTDRLVLGQQATDEKSNEITAIPALVERIDLEGALVSIDAMGCNPDIAQSILDADADYLLAVKDNQPNPSCRNQELFRYGTFQQARAGADCREGSWQARNPKLHRLPRGRLDNP